MSDIHKVLEALEKRVQDVDLSTHSKYDLALLIADLFAALKEASRPPEASVDRGALEDRLARMLVNDLGYGGWPEKEKPPTWAIRQAGKIMALIAPALSAAGEDWHKAALVVGEHIETTGPDGYYEFTAEDWRDWAIKRLTAKPAAGEPAAEGSGDVRLILAEFGLYYRDIRTRDKTAADQMGELLDTYTKRILSLTAPSPDGGLLGKAVEKRVVEWGTLRPFGFGPDGGPRFNLTVEYIFDYKDDRDAAQAALRPAQTPKEKQG